MMSRLFTREHCTVVKLSHTYYITFCVYWTFIIKLAHIWKTIKSLFLLKHQWDWHKSKLLLSLNTLCTMERKVPDNFSHDWSSMLITKQSVSSRLPHNVLSPSCQWALSNLEQSERVQLVPKPSGQSAHDVINGSTSPRHVLALRPLW